MSYAILVTYGNAWPNAIFARGIRSREDAEALHEVAIERGFRDAKIVDGAQLKAILLSRGRGTPDKARPARKAQDVHDLRTLSEQALAV